MSDNTVTRKVNSLGYIYEVDVPADYETFDAMAGKPNACLEEGISNVIYRGVNSDWRPAFLERVEEKLVAQFGDDYKRKEFDTGKTKKVKKGDEEVEEPVMRLEKEGDYEKRIIAQLIEAGELSSDEKDVKQAYFQEVIDALREETDENGEKLIRFDPKQKERKVASKRIPQYIYNTIDQLIGLGEDSVKAACAKLTAELGYEVDHTDKEKMARALYTRESKKDKDLERAKALAAG